ncbi:hypothetical protein Q2K19_22495 [Micromonospora soli]|uniref:hypothetical protein n=1 Tax=Micromonospora sp. NBRC 110009 TaxID=3061627 RepID=UPI0026740C27|nr:hypothetical protein [Micromonospora sp. NBRC 110009]WKT96939.1 hypothetical protein Q2K19_22495 [Micromonospora sp. NBRC 110009]
MAGLLTLGERQALDRRLMDWYYRDGNGMLLESATHQIFLTAKHNLTCRTSQLRPTGLMELLPETMSGDQKRGCLAIRQLSLLRTQMKVDMAIYGRPYVADLTDHEVAFLRQCRIGLRRRPWRSAIRAVPDREPLGGVAASAPDGDPTDRDLGAPIAAYAQVSDNYRAIDDLRLRLLALLPLATGTGHWDWPLGAARHPGRAAARRVLRRTVRDAHHPESVFERGLIRSR